MSNNDVKIDHEAAKKMAEAECRSPLFPGQASHNMAAAYLDAMAQRDEAREELAIFKRRRISETYLDGIEAQRDEALALLEKLLYYTIANESAEAIRAFLAKHRKTGASHGK